MNFYNNDNHYEGAVRGNRRLPVKERGILTVAVKKKL